MFEGVFDILSKKDRKIKGVEFDQPQPLSEGGSLAADDAPKNASNELEEALKIYDDADIVSAYDTTLDGDNPDNFKPEKKWDEITLPQFIKSSVSISDRFQSSEKSPTLDIISALTTSEFGDGSILSSLKQIEQRSQLLQQLATLSINSNLTAHPNLIRFESMIKPPSTII